VFYDAAQVPGTLSLAHALSKMVALACIMLTILQLTAAKPSQSLRGARELGIAAPGGACGSNGGGNTCPNGQCCSTWGWCGTTTDHCGSGCQPAYGACTGKDSIQDCFCALLLRDAQAGMKLCSLCSLTLLSQQAQSQQQAPAVLVLEAVLHQTVALSMATAALQQPTAQLAARLLMAPALAVSGIQLQCCGTAEATLSY
jgi:Chitin recognition protein